MFYTLPEKFLIENKLMSNEKYTKLKQTLKKEEKEKTIRLDSPKIIFLQENLLKSKNKTNN